MNLLYFLYSFVYIIQKTIHVTDKVTGYFRRFPHITTESCMRQDGF